LIADDSRPVVSVVVPAHNEAAYLPATLDSLDGLETTTPYEVIVVDGGSEGVGHALDADEPKREQPHRERSDDPRPGAAEPRGGAREPRRSRHGRT
jgi:cellulose synthase/poly-beta-1,6-N-acetylglucosamine synthase-like glycosyltransferase